MHISRSESLHVSDPHRIRNRPARKKRTWHFSKIFPNFTKMLKLTSGGKPVNHSFRLAGLEEHVRSIIRERELDVGGKRQPSYSLEELYSSFISDTMRKVIFSECV